MNYRAAARRGSKTRQFAAVVAHELGHCTQGLAMRLAISLIESTAAFVRVVYERDTWDESFEQWADSIEDSRLLLSLFAPAWPSAFTRCSGSANVWPDMRSVAFWPAKWNFTRMRAPPAWPARKGWKACSSGCANRMCLEQLAYNGLNQIWEKKHYMPDSVPIFSSSSSKGSRRISHEQARLTLLNEKAACLPLTRLRAQRIQKARQRTEPGIFGIEKPARALFNDFAGTAKLVTTGIIART